MNFFNSLFKKDEKEKKDTSCNNTNNPKSNSNSEITSNSNTNPSVVKLNPFKPRGKEIIENLKEEENIKIFTENKNFKFDLKVYGKSIFQNLILTASAYVEDSNGEKEVIPVKCIWRRIKRDIAVYIKEVNSNSNSVNSLETITLKKPNQVYEEILKKAREKAKEAKKMAITAYLELKEIKKTYMIDDIDDSDSELEVYSDEDDDNEYNQNKY